MPVDLNEKLSENFSLREALYSETAQRSPELIAEQNNPPEAVLQNLRYLFKTTAQTIRGMIGYSLRVNSAYRSPRLNAAIPGSSSTSQHCLGQAVDLDLDPDNSGRFLKDPSTDSVRKAIQDRLSRIVGKPIREDVNANFFLFALVVLNMDNLDVDQVIHEYGEGRGRPAWVHVSASVVQNKRQILAYGSYVPGGKAVLSLGDALAYGT